MSVLLAKRTQSEFIKPRYEVVPLDPDSVFSVWMNDASVADEIWCVHIKNGRTHSYAEVLKSSTNDLTIAEFFRFCVPEWELVSVVGKIWEEDF